MKNCRACLEDHPLNNFYNNKAMVDGKCSYCKPCDTLRKKELNRKYVLEGSTKYALQRRNAKLRSRYKIDQDDYMVMWHAQDGCCKICGVADPKTTKTHFLYVDHCHTTMKVRGLLCRGCNTGIGAFEDNTKSLLSAIKYLENK